MSPRDLVDSHSQNHLGRAALADPTGHRAGSRWWPTAPEAAELEVVRLLGIGGHCAVWLAHSRAAQPRPDDSAVVWINEAGQIPAEVAWKVPLVRPRAPVSLRGAVQEMEAMMPLAHDHLVRPWGVTRTAGVPGLLMEAFAAGSLAQLLRSGERMDPAHVVTALTPVASALEHLHQHGVSHGDVTAANILLSVQGRPALADLGESVLLGMGSVEATAAGDISGLARIAWEALTGSAPDSGLRRPPLRALRPDAPRALVELLEASLEPSADGPSAADFAAELFSCADPAPLDLMPHADDEVLAELPTRLPPRREPGPRSWTGLFKRVFSGRAKTAQRPSWASKLPSSKRAFRVWRKRPASAPSTMR